MQFSLYIVDLACYSMAGSTAFGYIMVSLYVSLLLNYDLAASSEGEVSLSSGSDNQIEQIENFKKFGLTVNTLKQFPVEENNVFKTINVIERLDDIDSIGVLKLFGKELLGADYDIDNLFDSTEREILVQELFNRWLLREGTEPVTCKALADALLLKRMAMIDMVEMIFATCRKYRVLDSPCKPKSFLLYSMTVSKEYLESYVIENEKLWLPTRLPKKKIQYIQLEFRDVVTDSNITLSDIFHDVKSNSRVLFTGRPGSGKSTLTRYLAKEFVANNMFDLVVRVHLGTNPRIDSLRALIDAGLTGEDNPTIVNTTAKFIQGTHGSNVCFLLDGYDEYLSTSDGSDYINRLISKSVLRESVVVLTSRPKAVEGIKDKFYHIEVAGFGDEGVQLYLEQFNASSVDTIYKYFALHPNIHQLCYLPLHLAMLVYIATGPVETGTLSIINTETLLYSNFFSLTVKQYEQANNKSVNVMFECYTDLKVHNDFCTLLRRLSEVSFEGVLKYKQTFTIRDFDGLPKNILVSDELKKLGLFKVDKIFDRGGEDLEQYSYAHPTFQEFFGAFHLAIISQYSQTDFLKIPETHEMYKFSMGLMSTKLKYDNGVVLRSFISYGRTILATYQNQELHMIKCAHEIGTVNFVESLKEVNVINQVDSVQLFTYDSLECWYIGHLLTHFPVYELGINKVSDLDLCISSLTKYLHLDPSGHGPINVTKLRLGHESAFYWPFATDLESKIHIHKLLEIIPLLSNDLMYLGLRHVTLESSESIMHIGSILKRFTQLKHIDLSLNFSLIRGGYLSEALKDITQLEHLELGAVNKYDEDTVIPDDVFELTFLKSITSFGFHSRWNQELVDVNLTAVLGGLRHMTGLKKLSIYLTLYNGLRTNGAEELMLGIKQLPRISDLELDLDLCWETGLGNVTIHELIRLFGELSMILKKLIICIDFNFSGITGSTGVVELADGLKMLSNLHTLSLELRWEIQDGANIDESSIALSNCLKSLHNLESLSLNLKHNGRLNQLPVAFQSLTQLKDIRIKWTRPGGLIGETEVPKLLSDLKTLTSLTKLDLSWNTITDHEMPSLIEALKDMYHLQVLDLSNNKIGGDEMCQLAEVIVRRLPNLEILLLNHNSITDVGAKHLTDRLKYCPKLHRLDLGLKLGNYSVQALLLQELLNKKNEVQAVDCPIGWYKNFCLGFFSSLTILLTLIICYTTTLSVYWAFKQHNIFSFSSALSHGLFSTSSAWRLDKLDTHDLDGAGTVMAILDTAAHPNSPIRYLEQIEARKDLPPLTCMFRTLPRSFDLLDVPSVRCVHHGSICALVAAGSSDMDSRVPRGVAPAAKILIYRISDGNSEDNAYSINKAVLFALQDIQKKLRANDSKVDVVSISYDLEDNEVMKDIKDIITELNEMNVSFVASAGNNGLFQCEAAIPAKFDKVICVGSLDEYGHPSKFDPDLVKTDVRAPGELSVPRVFKYVEGSSFASPAIGGIVLLLKQLANDIDPATSSKINNVKVLRHILKNYVTTLSKHNKPISDPVKFLTEVAINHDILKEIVQNVPLEDEMEIG